MAAAELELTSQRVSALPGSSTTTLRGARTWGNARSRAAYPTDTEVRLAYRDEVIAPPTKVADPANVLVGVAASRTRTRRHGDDILAGWWRHRLARPPVRQDIDVAMRP